MKKIAKYIFYDLMGWKIEGSYPEDLKKFIIIGAPHTSNYDFIVALFMKIITGVKANFIAKHTLFKPPFGFIFRSLGGIPLNRSKSKNTVDAIVDVFNSKDELILAIAPEGTRSLTEAWKTGFYHIAKGAGVPVVMNAFDFGKKIYRISQPYYLTGDIEKDFQVFQDFYKDVKGKHPEKYTSDFLKNMFQKTDNNKKSS